VVIALVADQGTASSMLEIRAFGTPTIVHFCAALLVSAIATAPWHAISSPGIAFGALGAVGIGYILSVIRHARKQTGYAPDAEDWFWYVILPVLAYAALLASALLFAKNPGSSMFAVSAVTLLLLFIGIHNSWDTVTYIAVGRRVEKSKSER
jgi:hypothetical protein